MVDVIVVVVVKLTRRYNLARGRKTGLDNLKEIIQTKTKTKRTKKEENRCYDKYDKPTTSLKNVMRPTVVGLCPPQSGLRSFRAQNDQILYMS